MCPLHNRYPADDNDYMIWKSTLCQSGLKQTALSFKSELNKTLSIC